MILSFTLHILTLIISAILAITFYTLFERKILAYLQIRKGPNKVRFSGIPQPIADAIKLFSKEHPTSFYMNITPFVIAPIVTLSIRILTWILCPQKFPFIFIKYRIILFITLSSINAYTPLIAGWASNSKYALLGALRNLAQTISYEISMTLIILCTLLFYSIFIITAIRKINWTAIIIISPHLFTIWYISILAEINRTPFDLAEGESEIVSGFNIEYRRRGFALLFISEYIIILIISIITSSLFIITCRHHQIAQTIFSITSIFFSFSFIWVRAALPRIRYDKLINLTWKQFLPFILALITLLLPLIVLLS